MTTRLTMPRTIRHDCPPGSLLKSSLAHRRENRLAMGRSPRQINTTHLAAVRLLPCLKCGMEPCGEAAHVRMTSAAFGKRNAGVGAKPDDSWSLPLCPDCHTRDPDAQHRLGEQVFWDHLGLNPLLICEALIKVSPDVTKMRAVVLSYIAERK